MNDVVKSLWPEFSGGSGILAPHRRKPGRPALFVLAAMAALLVAAVDPILARASTDNPTAGAAASTGTTDIAATKSIEDFHDDLLVVMQNADAWDFATRRAYLEPKVAASFDSGLMVRIASSSHWRKFTPEQRKTLTDLFRAFTLANYAFRFNGYSGQVFETLGQKEVAPHRVMVRTRLIKSAGDAVRIDYVLTDRSGSWAIIDVFVEGRFSEIAVRRSEFAPVLRDRGFDGLAEVLRNKIAEIEADAAAE